LRQGCTTSALSDLTAPEAYSHATHSRLLIAIALGFALASCTRTHNSVDIATTTSLDGSGLLQQLRTQFKADTGIELNAFVVGSGQAMQMARRGVVDLIITHDPVGERQFVLTQHPQIYRQFMWNDFVIVGPKADPASVHTARSAAEAFRRIHDAQAKFCSRNDQSGTHVKELALWRGAGISPSSNPNYLPLGQPMAHLLRSCEELQAYTLSDRATFDQLSKSLSLVIEYQGDPTLRNVYAVTVMRRRNANAKEFAQWLLSERGRHVVESFTIHGRREFFWMP
jgi:tungstate transport system substrate-binding protein